MEPKAPLNLNVSLKHVLLALDTNFWEMDMILGSIEENLIFYAPLLFDFLVVKVTVWATRIW